LDTGSSYSLISECLAEKLNLDVHTDAKQGNILCGNNTTMVVIGTAVIKLQIGKQIFTHTFRVLKELLYECLIGIDFMRKFGMQLNLQKNLFYFQDNESIKHLFFEYKDKKPIISICLPEKYSSSEVSSWQVDSNLKSGRSVGLNDDTSREQIDKLVQQMLEEFPTVVRKDDSYGQTDLTYHIIEYEGEPIYRRAYRRSPALRQVIKENVDHLLKHGKIRPSRSPYSAPVVLDKKKSGGWRMAIDYTALNEHTKTNASPMEDCNSILRQVPTGYWYTVIDCNSGFWQIPLDADSIEKSAFSTEDGHYEFLVMPFGLKNAPKTFQNLMNHIFKEYRSEFLAILMDDILVFSKTLEQHLQDVRKVLQKLKTANMTINKKKSKFAQRRVEYLGHTLTETGIKKQPEKVKAIQEYPTPRNIKDVQQFLGMCQWYSSFINGFATIAEPIYQLLRSGNKWNWGESQEKSFQELKRVMMEDVTLTGIDYKYPIIMKCDASDHGLGAVLVQKIDGKDRPVAFVSKLLKKSEKSAHIYEKELYAIIFAHWKFRQFIEGHRFTIQTDNRALAYLKKMKDKKEKLKRWAVQIDSWDADIVVRPGKENVEADALSRAPIPEEENYPNLFEEPEDDVIYTPMLNLMIPSITLEKLQAEQSKDEEVKNIILAMKKDENGVMNQNHPYKIEEKILKRKVILEDLDTISEALKNSVRVKELGGSAKNHSDDQNQKLEVTATSGNVSDLINPNMKKLDSNVTSYSRKCKSNDKKFKKNYIYVPVIPKKMIEEIMKIFHDAPESGHLGVTKTMNRIKQRAFWNGMNKDIREYVRSCEICQKINSANTLPYGLLHLVHPPSHVFEVICVDFMGPFPTSGKGKLNKYLLVVIDELSKWVELIPMRSARASKVVDFLEDQVFCRFGTPKIIVSDNGSQFTSKILQKMCKEWKIDHRFLSPYHPQQNFTERANKSLKKMIAAYVEENHKSWDEHLQKFALALRTAVNETTKVTPALLNLGRQIPIPFDRGLQIFYAHDTNEQIEDLKAVPEKLKSVISWVKDNIVAAHLGNKKHYDKKHRHHDFYVGDMVLIKNHILSSQEEGIMQKLAPKWLGPFRLEKQLTGNTFVIRDVDKKKEIGKRHVMDIKPFIPREKEYKDVISDQTNGQSVGRSLRKREPTNYRMLAGYKK